MNAIFLLPRSDRRRARPGLAALLAATLILAGCGRNTTKAIALESQSDQQAAANDLAGAADTMTRAIAYDGNDAGRLMKLARLRRALGQQQLAADAYRQALDLEPGNVEAMQNLAVIYVAARRFQEAKDIVDPLLTLAPGDIAGLLAKGAVAFYEDRDDEADEVAGQIIQLFPDNKEGYVLRAHVLEKKGNLAQAARLIESRLAVTPDDADMAEQLLGLYRRLGNVAGVRATSLRLARLRPDDPRYQLESLRADQAAGDAAAREKTTTAIVSRYRNNSSVLGALADFWRTALPAEEAKARIRALAGNQMPRARAALVRRLVEMGDYDGASALLAPLLAGPVGSGNVDLHAMQATLLVARGDIAGGHREAEAVLAFDPGNDVALLARARAFLADKAYDKALTDVQVALGDNPGDADAALLIAGIYAAQGNRQLAAAAYGDAQTRAPDNIAIARARAEWLIGIGRAAEAADIIGLFARTHSGRGEAWALYERTCRAAKDPICLRQAQAGGKG